MNRIEMRKSDLGELYALLGMYRITYGGVPEELMGEVEAAYKRGTGPGFSVGNPRGAGRKSGMTPEKIMKAKELRKKGHPIRKIAEEMGCSTGYVHKLIHEQEVKE